MNSYTPEEFRNLYETPPWLFNYLHNLHRFDIDLACNLENCKLDNGIYFDCGLDALQLNWHNMGHRGFCNPPYDDIDPWLEKAIKERELGFMSSFVIPMPNGESRDELIFKADNLIFIRGRVSFIAACDWVTPKGKVIKKGQEVHGSGRGTVIAEYWPGEQQQTIMSIPKKQIIDYVVNNA